MRSDVLHEHQPTLKSIMVPCICRGAFTRTSDSPSFIALLACAKMPTIPFARRADDGGGNHTGLTVGVVIGIVIVLALIALVIFFLWRRHRKHVNFVNGKANSSKISNRRRAREPSNGRTAHLYPPKQASDGADPQDGEPWPGSRQLNGKTGRNEQTELPPPAPGPFSYL